ncbi:FAD-dependent monooxygenase [Hasllibacter sp. MH4015]|uniref:FAD-dependent monooxygenase n=1 Tax=Hasllibacter sp. MH4015 TaxID=2854029 RepID=UPI001CD757A3|nr:FAD-dependent monooxygenase [Hasllibacter sp. MH4015]
MQYHLDGYRSGDPAVHPADERVEAARGDVDVLIVGCGPAGLTLAAQLAAFPDITTCIVDQKDGPLEVGQADGIACRSMEMFAAFGFADRVMKEAYWVNEVAFWRPDAEGKLHRADRIQDVEDDLSEMPHVILNQARVHDFYLEVMENAPTRLRPDYGRRLVALRRDNHATHPLEATFDVAGSAPTTIRARYVVGCDGARSAVRKSLGLALEGEAARQLWGVMDVLAVTDFPDFRLKAAIQSAGDGSILLIPREGGYMARLYIELDELHGDERAADRGVNADMLIAKARAILAPYRFDVSEVAWWSAYEIGQRVCARFDDAKAGQEPRIFIAGDACHTHSPKAGQGMNVSMADAFNLGWKLASVLRGQSDPALLRTYSEERQAKAQELIDFDRDMARLFSAKPKDADEAAQFQQYFKKHGRYTAGVETRYAPSILTGGTTHQHLAKGLVVGKRFHSAPVVRMADAKPMQLGHILKADGRWRVVVFAGADDRGAPGGSIARLCDWLEQGENSPLRRVTQDGADIDSVVDVRAVFQQGHRDLTPTDMPSLLVPTKGIFGLVDYEKVFCADPAHDIFDMRGIDRQNGALIVVRPDQFVAHVLVLSDHDALSAVFDAVLRPAGKENPDT